MNHIPYEIARIRQDELLRGAAERAAAPAGRRGATTAHKRSLLRLRRIVLRGER